MALGSTQLLTEMSTRNLHGRKGLPTRNTEIVLFLCFNIALEIIINCSRSSIYTGFLFLLGFHEGPSLKLILRRALYTMQMREALWTFRKYVLPPFAKS
jgi:hypothetical protein